MSSRAAGEKTGAHLYNIRFEASDLWGAGAEKNSAVYVDVFEPYIERSA